ncbi:MAG: L,D-transpeptidase, partial [Bdellovibrionales bacterium]|nr:L,D-transpeptidase [Oligoflexia bacterium]
LSEETIPEADPETLAKEENAAISAEEDFSKTIPLEPAFDRAMRSHVKVITYRRPLDFNYEFTLLVVDGKIQRAFLVSTAIEGKMPILGVHRLSVPTQADHPRKPWPWKTSSTYFDAPMYWALNIEGGYFIHSSPHYGNLGKPGSMGCIRESIPDAMEVFNAVANKYASSASYSVIFDRLKMGSKSQAELTLQKVLQDSGWTLDDLKDALNRNKTEIDLVARGDLEYAPGVPVDAHVRPLGDAPQVEASFPSCAGIDCWDLFRKKRAILKLKSRIAFKDPPKDEYKTKAPLALSGPSQINLDELLGHALKKLSAASLYDVKLLLTSGEEPLMIRICDKLAHQCSKARGPEINSSGESVYPLYQIANLLKSSRSLILDVQSGTGTLELATVRYYQ